MFGVRLDREDLRLPVEGGVSQPDCGVDAIGTRRCHDPVEYGEFRVHGFAKCVLVLACHDESVPFSVVLSHVLLYD